MIFGQNLQYIVIRRREIIAGGDGGNWGGNGDRKGVVVLGQDWDFAREVVLDIPRIESYVARESPGIPGENRGKMDEKRVIVADGEVFKTLKFSDGLILRRWNSRR
jgi:hypothetical protein